MKKLKHVSTSSKVLTSSKVKLVVKFRPLVSLGQGVETLL